MDNLAALNPSVLYVFPFVFVESVYLVSLLSLLSLLLCCDVLALLYYLILPRSAKG